MLVSFWGYPPISGDYQLEEALEEVEPNVCDERGETAACKICRLGHFRKLQSLCQASPDFSLADRHGASPLFLASQEGHTRCVRLLLEKWGAQTRVCINVEGDRWVAFVDQPLDSEATSLYVAAQNGHRDTVQLLIFFRADVNRATRDQATPLFIATQMGFKGIVDDLIDAKAGVDIGQKGNAEIVKLLFEKRADMNKQAQDGATPLLIASHNGNLATVQSLLSLKPVEKDLCMHSGASALFVSAQNGHLEVRSLAAM